MKTPKERAHCLFNPTGPKGVTFAVIEEVARWRSGEREREKKKEAVYRVRETRNEADGRSIREAPIHAGEIRRE